MSDEDYQKFLDNAAADASTRQPNKMEPKNSKLESPSEQDQPLPAILQGLIDQERAYSSESDEPFRAVVRARSELRGRLSTTLFREVFGKTGAEVGVKDFDTRGDYSDVIECVAEAAQRDVKDVQVFKTHDGHTKSDYWILTSDLHEQRIIGLVTTAVET